MSHSLDFIGDIVNKNSYCRRINNFIKLIPATSITTLIVITNKYLDVFVCGWGKSESQTKDWFVFPILSASTKGLEKTSILVYPLLITSLRWLGDKRSVESYWAKDCNYWPVTFLNKSDIECYMLYAQLSVSRRH